MPSGFVRLGVKMPIRSKLALEFWREFIRVQKEREAKEIEELIAAGDTGVLEQMRREDSSGVDSGP